MIMFFLKYEPNINQHPITTFFVYKSFKATSDWKPGKSTIRIYCIYSQHITNTTVMSTYKYIAN